MPTQVKNFMSAIGICLMTLVFANITNLSFATRVSAAEGIGQVEQQKGVAERRANGAWMPLGIADQVFEGDAIRTRKDARLIIQFADSSSLTLGENARITLDGFVYNASVRDKPSESQTISIMIGVFRFISGAIAKAEPQRTILNTPVATIGIRGTQFLGGELTVGMPPGQQHYGFQIESGAIEVRSAGGTGLLDEPGEGTFLPLTGLAAPVVRQWRAEVQAEALDALAF